ncbi:hypothetical protein, partial [Kordiimonas sediminis]|uniref:hypothetical protein n=1 Tax=Kordiimonas sediminis TaxID=1735581 RepID=UPI001748C1CD
TTLKQVHKLASKLATALDSLDEVSASRLYSAYVRIERTKPLPGFGGYMRDEAFSTTIKSPASLAQYAEEAARYKPTISKGRTILVSVETLILNLKSYWEDTLGRKFTYDEHEGEGITDAFLFCRDVCAVITPDIPATAIASKMRKLISK